MEEWRVVMYVTEILAGRCLERSIQALLTTSTSAGCAGISVMIRNAFSQLRRNGVRSAFWTWRSGEAHLSILTANATDSPWPISSPTHIAYLSVKRNRAISAYLRVVT